MTESDAHQAHSTPEDPIAESKRSKFRFKSSHKGESSSRREHDEHRSSRKRSRRHDDSEEHRRHRRKRPRSSHSHIQHDPYYDEDSDLRPNLAGKLVDEDEAFRESLFDAMADDEGAAYWEGVYGQPIHVFPDTKKGPEGELERMTEEEYVSHVRQRMWEKTHQHVVEERMRREEERKKQKERDKERERLEREHSAFQSLVGDALRRGERRKNERSWTTAWKLYCDRWDAFLNPSESDAPSKPDLVIPWPVRTGEQRHVSQDNVQEFFRRAPDDQDGPLLAILKTERVRWHPDKMQQRSRGQELSEDTLRSITAVFQTIDDMWSAMKRTTPSAA